MEFPTWTTLGSNIPNLINCGSNNSLMLNISGYFSYLQDACYTIPSDGRDAATRSGLWIKGNHTVQFGFEVVRSKMIKKQDFMGDGRFDFMASLSGNNLLDFMLGKGPPI